MDCHITGVDGDGLVCEQAGLFDTSAWEPDPTPFTLGTSNLINGAAHAHWDKDYIWFIGGKVSGGHCKAFI